MPPIDLAIPAVEARMFNTIVAKWSEMSRTARTVVIPLDRPDLMADAGHEGLRYQNPVSQSRFGMGWQAGYRTPFGTAGR